MKTPPEQLSLWQLFSLMVTFFIGSAAIISPAKEAGHAYFLIALIVIPIGIGVLYFFLSLVSKQPQKDLFELMQLTLGRVFSKVLILIYSLYFLYIAARVLRDFVEMINTVILPTTPMTVISLSMMLVIIYILSLGLEVLGRIGELFLPIMSIMFLLVVLLLFMSGEVHPQNVLPIFGEGIQPIIHTIFPLIMTFPVGEMIIFTLFFSKVSQFRYAKKVGIYAIIFTCLNLSLMSFAITSALGVDAMKRSDYPLLNTARLISIGNFIERTDALVIFVITLGVVIKIGLFFYGGMKGVTYVFHLPDQTVILPIGLLISVMSILIARSYAEHITEGLEVVTTYIHLPLQYGIPICFLLLVLWKHRKKDNDRKRRGVS